MNGRGSGPWVVFLLHCSLALRAEEQAVASFAEVPHSVAIHAKGALDQLEALSLRETFLQTVFGRDCFSQAYNQVNRACNQMSTEDKYRLAHQMNRLCLYVANKDFERHTSQLLNKLYEGSTAAHVTLHGVSAGLQLHKQEQHAMLETVSQLRVEQSSIAQGLRQGLEQLGTIQQSAAALELQIDKTLAMEEEMSRRQGQLLQQVVALEELEERHSAAAGQQWEAVLQRAEQMERRQAAYEALQEALARSSSQLLQHSGQLQGAIDSVLVAQQRTSTLLGRVLGGHWTLKDLAFYVASAALALVLTVPSSLQPMRLPLLALLFLTAFGERLLRRHVQMWLPLLDAAGIFAPLASAVGSAEQIGWLLRALMGGAAAVLLLRQAIAKHRRGMEDRHTLRVITQQLEQLHERQALLVQQQRMLLQHVLGSNPPQPMICAADASKQHQLAFAATAAQQASRPAGPSL
ncbi:hypothetical protein TSOC_003040 [Tetrabaena socialis]|uniref:Uncharacterized protein n=1 Tax=Tetrabaena socialis TaxID=47790 RepID=A0A2J8ACI8_9CHLO|nr:hypothetical protein TSOC_003040 [Tetrabaena socialis]|eukprot:PNH10228.1 hypothetical protein TSOC_003040 [Tetrabaena socialis]